MPLKSYIIQFNEADIKNMSLLNLENVPNREISGLLDNESQWVTWHDFEGRFLKELSDSFLGPFWTEENEDNSNDILEELNDRKLQYSSRLKSRW